MLIHLVLVNRYTLISSILWNKINYLNIPRLGKSFALLKFKTFKVKYFYNIL